MLRNYDNADWIVNAGDKDFCLSEAEMEIIKKAALAGTRLVWFDDLVISVLHIAFAERIRHSRPLPVDEAIPKLPDQNTKGIEIVREKIVELGFRKPEDLIETAKQIGLGREE